MARTVEESAAKLELAISDRANFDRHWQDVADLVAPSREFLEHPDSIRISQGQQRNTRIFNDAAPGALTDFAGQMHGMLSNPAIRWFELRLVEGEGTHEEQKWMRLATNAMLAYFDNPASGFPTASHEVYLDLGAFGTAVCQVGPPKNDWLRFSARSLSCTWYLDDDEGLITDVFRASRFRLRDMAVEFGALTPELAEAAKSATGSEQRETVIHHVFANRDRDPTIPTNLHMPWGSRYFVHSKKTQLSISGFLENPYLTPRWSKMAEETYGRGPAMVALPGIKGANAMSRDQLIAGELRVRPPINVFANSVQGTLSLVPGAINYLKQGTRDFPSPLATGADPATGDAMIERAEKKIERQFFQDALRVPDKTHLTVDQIRALLIQNLVRTSPIFSRVVAEWLWPSIQRVFDWMLESSLRAISEGRQPFFPAPPRSLIGRPLRPFFTSPLAQSQRQAESQNIQEGFQLAALAAQVDPAAMLNLDTDVLVRLGWSLRNADPRVLRTPQKVAALRRKREEDEAQAAQADDARNFAAAGKDAAIATRELQGAPP